MGKRRRLQKNEGSAAASPGAAPRYFEAIDGLRGAAILAVLLYHTNMFHSGLFMAVDLFMALSGFLITFLLVKEVEKTGRVAVGAFYRKRVKRLMPGLVIVLGITVGIAYVYATTQESAGIRRDAVAAVFQVANWVKVAEDAAYWQGFGRLDPLAHMWSESMTWQFYAVWPLLFALTGWVLRRRIGALTAGMYVLFLASALVAPLLYDGHNTDRLYLNTAARSVAFTAGAAAACSVHLLLRRPGRRRHGGSGSRAGRATAVGLVCLGSLAALMATTSSYHDAWLYQGGLAVVAALSALLCAVLCYGRGLLNRLLSWGPLAAVGRISYPLYLVHMPIYWLYQKLQPAVDPLRLLVGGGGLALLAAAFLHHGVTEPLRLVRWRRGAALPAVAVLTAAVTAGAWITPSVVSHRMLQAGKPTVLVLGDSVGEDISAALADHGGGKFGVVDSSIRGCGFFDSDAVVVTGGARWPNGEPCRQWRDTWKKSLRESDASVIVIHVGWDAAGQEVDGRVYQPTQEEYRSRYREKLKGVGELLAEHAPETPVLLMNERVETSVFERTEGVAFNELIAEFAAADDADSDQVRMLDLAGLMCDDTRCRQRDDGDRPLYTDGMHFTADGRRFIAPWLEDAVSLQIMDAKAR